MKLDRRALKLYAVTDGLRETERSLAQRVEAALKGGATCLQLREKEMADDEFLQEALDLARIAKAHGIPFIINDNAQVALDSGADGVHIGQSDISAPLARKMIGDSKILGVSAHTVEQAVQAELDGADYLGVGAVFPTATKLDADAVSYDVLKSICDAVSIPVVAIGGITKENIFKLKGSKIAGVALVSAIFSQSDIEAECRLLRKLADEATT